VRYENALFGSEQDFVRLESVVKNDGEQRAVNRDVALYSMNPSSRNLFMKKLTRSRGAHHLGEYLLRELRQPRRLVFLAVARASRFSLELKS
jgi:hypothetical protein